MPPARMDPKQLLVDNYTAIERLINLTCRRNGLAGPDAEDFSSTVKLKLVENDYAVIRKFQGRSSLSTYLTTVIQRALLDYRIHAWGKWHPSAEAKRLGDAAIELERLIHRDGRERAEAVAIMLRSGTQLRNEELDSIASRLPERPPRRRSVPLDDVEPLIGDDRDSASRAVFARDQKRLSARASDVLARLLSALPVEDRLILQMRFDGGLSVAQIARALDLDQKALYRRMDRMLGHFRKQLEQSGIGNIEVEEIVGEGAEDLDFGLRKSGVRPSIEDGHEVSQ